MSELADFVLSAFREAGGIVEPPAYGIYEILLPEEVARHWDVPAYRRLAFTDTPPADMADAEDFTIVGYGHPLVEMLMEEARAEPACVQVYINDLRLNKRGLLELARQALAFPNARLTAIEHKSETPMLCHYVRFNFKAALITDEKRERLISVVMDVQAGFAVPELIRIEQLARLEEEAALGHPLTAPVRWLPGPGREDRVLSRPVLEGLLERATHAALDELAAPLETLRRRAARYLELDQARLVGYYDDIARDLQRRIERTDDDGRRTLLEDKLAAAQAERETKLADVEAKYRLRVELELINLQVIAQPKILLPVRVGNRTAKIERTIVWDPLLHRIEPLTCDVCGRPATRLTLCTGGHLAHEDCLLAEQCVDCKRIYCRLCTDLMGRCVVCDRPVCTHSLNRCDVCGRATCREHVGLCHAADGQPAQLPPPESPEPAPSVEKVEAKPTPPPPRSEEKKRKTNTRAARRTRRPVKKQASVPVPDKIEVYVEPHAPVVNAFVLTKGRKQVAVRSWELTDEGILVTCRCDKWYRCPVDGTMLEPAGVPGIEAQIEEQVESLRREYGVSAKRIFRYIVAHSAPRQVPRVVLRGEWRVDR
ncbi:MAG: hypothetical protein SXV54_09950 [Chloroflexota bacterium]|nr:hypothetical protein [Chloroflexota bacterium]